MKYFFFKWYNPAYEHFIIKYFKEGGIDFDENLTFTDVEPRGLFADKIPSPTPHEKLFINYIRAWRYHPEGRPSTDFFFYAAIGTEHPSIKKLRELEAQVPMGQRLLFTKEDAAKEIAHFYKRYMHDALSRDLGSGKVGLEISKYFSTKEWKDIPDVRVVGREKMEEEIQRKARPFLAWLSDITPDKIARQIDQVLEEHSGNAEHMISYPRSSNDPLPRMSCDHETDYAKLSCSIYHDGVTTLYLRPSRGFRVWEKHKWEDDWSDFVFPQYSILKEDG